MGTTTERVLNKFVVLNGFNHALALDSMKRLVRQNQNPVYMAKSELERWIKLLETK